MRMRTTAAAMLSVLWAAGCGDGSPGEAGPAPEQVHPAVAEARKAFTYEGKQIPPFFVDDFNGGPGSADIWLRETGDRIVAVAVDGLFTQRDGSYAQAKIRDHSGDNGFVMFDQPADPECPDARTGYAGYRFVGTSTSGVTVLEYVVNTGGSGTLTGVLFARFEMQPFGIGQDSRRERLVMRLLAARGWGDRVYRDVRLEGDTLHLGPAHSPIPFYQKSLTEQDKQPDTISLSW